MILGSDIVLIVVCCPWLLSTKAATKKTRKDTSKIPAEDCVSVENNATIHF